MQNNRSILLIFAIGMLLPLSVDAQTTIVRSVIGNGPTVATSGTTIVAATLGQPVIGLTTQNTLGVYQGFWGAVYLTLSVESAPEWGGDQTLSLSQASPNPSTGRSTSWVSLPGPTHVVATLHDGLGRELLRPLDALREAGSHQIIIDAETLSSGVYYLRVTADGVVRTVPVVVEQ